MSYNNKEIGGAYKRLSGRPSIHSHSLCPFAYAEAMGRYGVDRSVRRANQYLERIEQVVEQDSGADEVDNVFSKPAHPVSPSSFTRRNKNRRNSLEPDDRQFEEDSNTLSKSLPATLPSRLYCSDTTDEDIMIRNENYNSDTAFHTARVTNRTEDRFNRSGSVSTLSFQKPQTQEKPKTFKLVVASIVLLLSGVAASMLNNTRMSNNVVVYDESQFYNDMDLLGDKYKIDANAVLRMQTGIATIFKKQDTGSFMFVYNSNNDNFKSIVFNKFVHDVAVTASKYLRNESTPVHYTKVDGAQLQMFDHSELIGRFRDDLGRTGAMLVRHLEAVPSSLAMAFHYYCDEYNPLVKKSAIFFTLNLAQCGNSGKKTTHCIIEKCLAEKWNSVPADSIGPLLTRVVSVVIDLSAAFKLNQ